MTEFPEGFQSSFEDVMGDVRLKMMQYTDCPHAYLHEGIAAHAFSEALVWAQTQRQKGWGKSTCTSCNMSVEVKDLPVNLNTKKIGVGKVIVGREQKN